jgi:hypothetical protein
MYVCMYCAHFEQADFTGLRNEVRRTRQLDEDATAMESRMKYEGLSMSAGQDRQDYVRGGEMSRAFAGARDPSGRRSTDVHYADSAVHSGRVSGHERYSDSEHSRARDANKTHERSDGRAPRHAGHITFSIDEGEPESDSEDWYSIDEQDLPSSSLESDSSREEGDLRHANYRAGVEEAGIQDDIRVQRREAAHMFGRSVSSGGRNFQVHVHAQGMQDGGVDARDSHVHITRGGDDEDDDAQRTHESRAHHADASARRMYSLDSGEDDAHPGSRYMQGTTGLEYENRRSLPGGYQVGGGEGDAGEEEYAHVHDEDSTSLGYVRSAGDMQRSPYVSRVHDHDHVRDYAMGDHAESRGISDRHETQNVTYRVNVDNDDEGSENSEQGARHAGDEGHVHGMHGEQSHVYRVHVGEEDAHRAWMEGQQARDSDRLSEQVQQKTALDESVGRSMEDSLDRYMLG